MHRPPDHSPPPAGPWQGLDPLTRLVISVATLLAAILLTGPACLGLLAVVAVVLPAVIARRLGAVLRGGLLLALPLVISVVLVNLLLPSGPLEEGARVAIEAAIRALTMAGTVVLFYATTRPGELVASLQAHGLPARATFVIHNGVAMIPRLAEQAAEVTAAQRARGLDTEGSWWRRGRGLTAVAVPTVLGALAEVETRTLALESRGFTRPGRPTLLLVPRDSRRQRAARWGMVLAVAALALLRATGASLPC